MNNFAPMSPHRSQPEGVICARSRAKRPSIRINYSAILGEIRAFFGSPSDKRPARTGRNR